MLFATLDTFRRKIRLESGHEFILIDTVGFVSKLPHALVEAFKATLEEVTEADLLLHVVDASFAEHQFQMEVTNTVLKEMNANKTPSVILFNKADLLSEEERENLTFSEKEETLLVSAKTGEGWGELLGAIENHLFGNQVKCHLIIPFSRGDITSYLCEKYVAEKMEYTETGTEFIVSLSPEDASRFKEYQLTDQSGK